MKKVGLIIFGFVIIFGMFINIKKINMDTKYVSTLTLDTIESRACCLMGESNGYEEWCVCGYVTTCYCISGEWVNGRAWFL